MVMTKKWQWSSGGEKDNNDIDKLDIDASPSSSSSSNVDNRSPTTTTSDMRSRGTRTSPQRRSTARTPVAAVIDLVNLDSPNGYSYASTESARKKRRARSCGYGSGNEDEDASSCDDRVDKGDSGSRGTKDSRTTHDQDREWGRDRGRGQDRSKDRRSMQMDAIRCSGVKNESWRKKEVIHPLSYESSSGNNNDSTSDRKKIVINDSNKIPSGQTTKDKANRKTELYKMDSDKSFNKVIKASTSTGHTINIAQTSTKGEKRKRKLTKMEAIRLDDDDSDGSVVVVVDPPKNIIKTASSKSTVCLPSTTAQKNPTQKNDQAKSKRMESQSSKSSRKKSSTSNKTMVQQTLFGKIVKQIQNTDASKLPNKPLEYDKKRRLSLKRQGNNLDMETANEANVDSAFFSTEPSFMSSSSSMSQEQSYQRALDILQSTFNISSLRALQPNAIRTTLARKSQIIVMATGGGKSLCYQLPALVFPGVTIVISPLIALMVDQVQGLLRKGIEAAMISSSNSAKENQIIMQRLLGKNHDIDVMSSNGKSTKTKSSRQSVLTATTKPLKIVYCTPELVQTNKFRAILTHLYQNNQLSSIAIDEAHCLSTWGHDFRPAYRKLSWLRSSFPSVPCLAATATATPRVIEDIKQVLQFGKEEECWKSTFNRENIKYEVRYKDAMGEEKSMKDLVEIVRDQHKKAKENGAPCSGIIYVHKRDATGTISKVLQKAGISASPYHGGMKDSDRKRMQKEWMEGKVEVAVATVALGMGIDLAHIRYVVHWHMSKTIEGFYQESGRAGRDGNPSISVLYFSRDDLSRFAYVIKKEMERKEDKARREKGSWRPSPDHNRDLKSLYKMADYASNCCRRKFLLQHFGEDIDPAVSCRKTCDFCSNPEKVEMNRNKCYVAKAVKDVKRQQRGFSQSYPYSKERGDEGNSDNSEMFEIDHDTYDSDLGVTVYDPSHAKINRVMHSSGFTSAKSILQHYETLECGYDNKKSGFVKFKAKDSGRKIDSNETRIKNKGTSFNIPTHLMKQVQAKSTGTERKTKITQKSSMKISQEADEVRAQLDEIRRKKEALLAKMGKGAR